MDKTPPAGSQVLPTVMTVAIETNITIILIKLLPTNIRRTLIVAYTLATYQTGIAIILLIIWHFELTK